MCVGQVHCSIALSMEITSSIKCCSILLCTLIYLCRLSTKRPEDLYSPKRLRTLWGALSAAPPGAARTAASPADSCLQKEQPATSLSRSSKQLPLPTTPIKLPLQTGSHQTFLLVHHGIIYVQPALNVVVLTHTHTHTHIHPNILSSAKHSFTFFKVP